MVCHQPGSTVLAHRQCLDSWVAPGARNKADSVIIGLNLAHCSYCAPLPASNCIHERHLKSDAGWLRAWAGHWQQLAQDVHQCHSFRSRAAAHAKQLDRPCCAGLVASWLRRVA
jgi:hypothetical protein